jgi:SAM-dependent methyltransferase
MEVSVEAKDPGPVREGTTFETGINPQRVWELGVAYFSYCALITALDLRLFDLLAGKPATEPALRARVGLHPRLSRDFLDTLVATGMLQRDDGVYSNSPVADYYFDSRKPTSVAEFLKAACARWGRLADALRTGEPQGQWQGGARTELFTEEYQDEHQSLTFMAWSDYLGTMNNARIADAFDWSGVESVLDVGGGRGTTAARIVRANPHLRATILELPQTKPYFEELMSEFGGDGRIQLQAGDFFADPWPDADVILFGGILHDWGEDERRTLVKRAFHALTVGGTLLAWDHLIDDDRREKVSSLIVSMNMALVAPGASGYTVAECQSWLQDAGFTAVSATPLGNFQTLVAGRKAG